MGKAGSPREKEETLQLVVGSTREHSPAVRATLSLTTRGKEKSWVS